MTKPKKAKVLSFYRFRGSASTPEAAEGGDRAICPESAFLYTVDLLMEDFAKPHDKNLCVLCEPMKVMGMHRDEVMQRIVFSLFTTFFPSLEDYLLQIRGKVMESLLQRKSFTGPGSWKNKLKEKVEEQIEEDAKDFMFDILKHLKKFSQVEIDTHRQQNILTLVLRKIHSDWMKPAN